MKWTFPVKRAAKAAAPEGSTTRPRLKATFTVELKSNGRGWWFGQLYVMVWYLHQFLLRYQNNIFNVFGYVPIRIFSCEGGSKATGNRLCFWTSHCFTRLLVQETNHRLGTYCSSANPYLHRFVHSARIFWLNAKDPDFTWRKMGQGGGDTGWSVITK